MNETRTLLDRFARIVIAGALSASSGCRSTAHTPACADIPHGAIPQPSGTYTCQWQSAQAARAELDDFVIYSNEWSGEPATLAPCGQAHVAGLVERLANCPDPVIIQPSGSPELDHARQAHLIDLLAIRGVPAPGERVIVAKPSAEGLYGFEAPRIIRGYSQAGTYRSGAGGSGAGFGGGLGTSVGTGFGGGYGGGGFNTGGFF